jgi:adenine-specific DNA-methyltransferase
MPEPILTAPAPNQHKLDLLREHFPQAVEVDAQGRIRINAAALQQVIDPSGTPEVQAQEDGYELRWVGKRQARQSALAPVQKILDPLPHESKNWDTTRNLLLRGDNLDALRLLRQSYAGQVKLIYIDPPYNTQGADFIYRDNFSAPQSQLLAQLGCSPGNIEDIKNLPCARTHSGWLSFMYPRLLLARDLLRDDGVIFISIDDNEQAQLKLLCDEVFGPQAFVGLFPWRKRTAKSDVPFGVSQDYEWILCYANAGFVAGNAHARDYHASPDWPHDRWRLADLTKQTSAQERPNSAFNMRHPKTGKVYPFNPKRVWAVTKDTFQSYYDRGKIVFPGDYDFLKIKNPAYRVFESEDKAKALRKYGSEAAIKAVSTLLPKEVGLSGNGNKDFGALFEHNFFSFPKPVALLHYLIGAATDGQDLVLDFFAGSGTTAEALMRLNAEDGGQRAFILVQSPQPIDPHKQKQAYRFVREELGKPEATIFEITAERVRRAGRKIDAAQAASSNPEPGGAVDTGFRVFDVVDEPSAAVATPGPAHLPRVLCQLLLAEGLPLTTPLHTLQAQQLYLADDVLFIVQALALDVLAESLRQLQIENRPALRLAVYAPWMADVRFIPALKTLAQALGYAPEQLRLRG